MEEEEWEKLFSNSVSHSPDQRNKCGEAGRMLLSPQEIWKRYIDITIKYCKQL